MFSNESPFELLARMIPGYNGHRELEKRREDDRKTRAFLSRRLQECKSLLDRRLRSMVEKNPLEGMAFGEKVRRNLQHIQDRIDSAVEGYSTWFEQRQVNASVLMKVVEADADLVGLVDRLHIALESKNDKGSDFTLVESLLNQLNGKFDKRYSLLRGDAG